MNNASKKYSPSNISGVRQKDIPPVEDCPTPVFELGYRELSAKLMILSSRFHDQSLIYAKHPLKLDIAKSVMCTQFGDECKRIANKITDWPNKTGATVATEKSRVTERYLEIMSEAIKLMEGKVF